MAYNYRARINTADPRLQVGVRNAMKEGAAVPGASAAVRGLYSRFAGAEGERLSRAEQAGEALKNQAAYRKKMYKLDKRSLDLKKRLVGVERDKLSDATLGMYIGSGIGLAQLGLGAQGMAKDREALAQQKRFDEYATRKWVNQNPQAAINYHAYDPAYGLYQKLDVNNALAGRSGHEAFRMSSGTRR